MLLTASMLAALALPAPQVVTVTTPFTEPLRRACAEAQLIVAGVVERTERETVALHGSVLADLAVDAVLKGESTASTLRLRAPSVSSHFLVAPGDVGRSFVLLLGGPDEQGTWAVRGRLVPEDEPRLRTLIALQAQPPGPERERALAAWLLAGLDHSRWRRFVLRDLADNLHAQRPRGTGPWGSDLWAVLTAEQRGIVADLLAAPAVPHAEAALAAFLVEDEPDARIPHLMLDRLATVGTPHWKDDAAIADLMDSVQRRLGDEALRGIAQQVRLRGATVDPALVTRFVERGRALLPAR